MSLSSCVKCWDTPCECGWEYRNWTPAKREAVAAVVLGLKVSDLRAVISAPEKHPLVDDEHWDENKH